MYWIIYGNSRAESTEDLLRSVLLFWMVEPLSCRSFHKRDQEIFWTFLSSINIEHCPRYIIKNWHWSLFSVDVFVRSYKPSSYLPWRKVWIVYKGSLHTGLSPGRETSFSKYIYWWFAFQCFFFNNFSRYFGQGRRFLPPGTFTFPTSSIHVLLETRFTMF